MAVTGKMKLLVSLHVYVYHIYKMYMGLSVRFSLMRGLESHI